MYCIYLHRNKINNKVYIGQTKFGDNPNKRWQNGNGYKENISFYYDIQKYGWNNFEHIILENNLTLDESNKLEKQYIYHIIILPIPLLDIIQCLVEEKAKRFKVQVMH